MKFCEINGSTYGINYILTSRICIWELINLTLIELWIFMGCLGYRGKYDDIVEFFVFMNNILMFYIINQINDCY